MKIIDYVYENKFSSPNLIGNEDQQFKNKQEILDWILTAYCPTVFIKDFPYYKPIKKGRNCSVYNTSERNQKKVCTICWNREYSSEAPEDEYQTYLRLKEKYEKET